MSYEITYILSGALGMLALLLAICLVVIAVKRMKRKDIGHNHTSPSGAKLLSTARYRGRRVAHYSDGTVIAETRFGSKSFESFDAYRYYVDRR